VTVRVMGGIALVLAISSCAGWHRVALTDELDLGARQKVEVWRGGARHTVHGVTVTRDTLYGVPFTQAPDCTSCRIAIPRAEVDSVRVGDPEAAGGAVLVLGGFLALFLYLAVTGRLLS
jgi:hypothetical protein